eukprot:190235_1
MAVGCIACDPYSFKSSFNEDNMICQTVASGDYAYFGFGSSHDCIASDCDDFTLSGTVDTLKDEEMYIAAYDKVTCGRGLDSNHCGDGAHVCDNTLSGYFGAPWFDFSHCLWGIQAPNSQSINSLITGPRDQGPPPGLEKVALSRDLTPEQIAALTSAINDNIAPGNSGLAQAMVDALHEDLAVFPKGNNGPDPAKVNDEVRAQGYEQVSESPVVTSYKPIVIVLAFMIGLVVGGLFVGLLIYCKYHRKFKGMISVSNADESDDEVVDVCTTVPKDTEGKQNA